ncbi:MAG: extracellular solute-binding protein [Kiritimatiellae bacterium]|nr:extracellular solute-binding protein [Kiritimatiellia bacterium]
MRTYWRILAAGMLVVGMGAGCGRKTETPQQAEGGQSITIWWAQWAPADGLQELGNLFERETGIAVKVHQIPWASYQDQVFLEFGSKRTDFDIVVGDSQWIGRGATKGLYLDISDWLPTAVDLATVHPRALRYLCEYPAGSGRYFAAPCETDAVGFAYRRDWFEAPEERAAFKSKYGRELAVPQTWNEFRDVAEFFTRPDQKRYGCALLTGRGYDSLTMGVQQFLWAFGASWGDEKTGTVRGHLNTDASVAALEFVKNLLNFAPKGAANFDYSKTMEHFISGSTAMAMDYFAFFPTIVEKMGEQAGFFTIPKQGDRRVASLGGQGFSISQKVPAAQQELAKTFIAWFLKTDVQRQWITKPAGFTANTEILKSDAFRQATAYNAPFADSMDYLQDFWNVPVYNELLAAAQKHIGEFLDGRKSARDALDQLAAEHEQILADAGLGK